MCGASFVIVEIATDGFHRLFYILHKSCVILTFLSDNNLIYLAINIFLGFFAVILLILVLQKILHFLLRTFYYLSS